MYSTQRSQVSTSQLPGFLQKLFFLLASFSRHPYPLFILLVRSSTFVVRSILASFLVRSSAFIVRSVRKMYYKVEIKCEMNYQLGIKCEMNCQLGIKCEINYNNGIKYEMNC